MSEQTESIVVNGVKLDLGRIYLRDKRNGRIFQYEDALAELSYIERFEFTGELPTPEKPGTDRITLSGLAKAADWDRLASMKPEEREAELERRSAYELEQSELKSRLEEKPVEEDSYANGSLTLNDRSGPTIQGYYDAGWSDQQLLDGGLATPK